MAMATIALWHLGQMVERFAYEALFQASRTLPVAALVEFSVDEQECHVPMGLSPKARDSEERQPCVVSCARRLTLENTGNTSNRIRNERMGLAFLR